MAFPGFSTVNHINEEGGPRRDLSGSRPVIVYVELHGRPQVIGDAAGDGAAGGDGFDRLAHGGRAADSRQRFGQLFAHDLSLFGCGN